MKSPFRMLAFAFLALLAMSLMGCATAPKEVIVYKTEYILVAPLDAPLAHTRSATPPDPIQYKNASLLEREDMLVDYSNAQTTQLGICNANKKTLREWKADQLKLQAERQKVIK